MINMEIKRMLHDIYKEDFYLYSNVKKHANFFNFEGKRFKIS